MSPIFPVMSNDQSNENRCGMDTVGNRFNATWSALIDTLVREQSPLYMEEGRGWCHVAVHAPGVMNDDAWATESVSVSVLSTLWAL